VRAGHGEGAVQRALEGLTLGVDADALRLLRVPLQLPQLVLQRLEAAAPVRRGGAGAVVAPLLRFLGELARLLGLGGEEQALGLAPRRAACSRFRSVSASFRSVGAMA